MELQKKFLLFIFKNNKASRTRAGRQFMKINPHLHPRSAQQIENKKKKNEEQSMRIRSKNVHEVNGEVQ